MSATTDAAATATTTGVIMSMRSEKAVASSRKKVGEELRSDWK
jgi:hypothetical protein